MITLTRSQQNVFDRLAALPGAHPIAVKVDEHWWRPYCRPQVTLTITGGFHRDGTRLSCGHYEGSRHERATFAWKNNAYQGRGYRSGIEHRLQRLERQARETVSAS